MSAKPMDAARHPDPAKRVTPGDGIGLVARRHRQGVWHLRPAADDAVDVFVDVDERPFHVP
ncbi:MAG: hypothetical protein EXQ50_14795 [Acidobacteria bacterium]|nr:hypothetical protein [Acidobacteriota bacterium]